MPLAIAAGCPHFLQGCYLGEINNVESSILIINDNVPLIRLGRHESKFGMWNANDLSAVEPKFKWTKRSGGKAMSNNFRTHIALKFTRLAERSKNSGIGADLSSTLTLFPQPIKPMLRRLENVRRSCADDIAIAAIDFGRELQSVVARPSEYY